MLSSTLVLKDAANADRSFVQIDTTGTTDGIVRVDAGLVRPDRCELRIRHQPAGQGLSKGKRHNLSLTRMVKDDVGNVRNVVVNISVTVPEHPSITNELVADLTHQGFDAFVSTGTFVIDSTFLASLLLGES